MYKYLQYITASRVLLGYRASNLNCCVHEHLFPLCFPTGVIHTIQKLKADLSVAELLRREQQDVSAVHTLDHTQSHPITCNILFHPNGFLFMHTLCTACHCMVMIVCLSLSFNVHHHPSLFYSAPPVTLCPDPPLHIMQKASEGKVRVECHHLCEEWPCDRVTL